MANPRSEASVAMMSATVQQRKDRGSWRVVVHRAGKRRVFECKTGLELATLSLGN